ncbi:LysR family transcriptional regulator ArgP [Plantactinospora sp. WMMB782]|uniref:LysR family transcriptional regulator ArgP n=1 Tax=Plantactinospora sp. WMMB782 TaxID=3404121 RepID=UPI003B936D29
MDLQLEQLRTFVAVVDDGSFEAAARRLHVTPSAVSQRMKALESTVGRVLIERGKPARPTPSGRVVLRLARQVALLATDALRELGQDSAEPAEFSRIPIVVNSDSLNIWVLPALADAVRQRICVDVYREDQDHSAELLRRGTVMAAITSESRPVQGCSVRPLGRMSYRPMASPEYVRTWLPEGPTPDALARAPMVVFDRRDDLQDCYLRRRSRREWNPPRSYLPSSGDFPEAIRLGLGWGMMPPQQIERCPAGSVVPIDPAAVVEVPLYWQQWRLDSRPLGILADSVASAAAAALDR